MRFLIFSLVFYLFGSAIGICAPYDSDTDPDEKKGSFFALPAMIYTSDTGLGLGAGAIKSYYTSGEQVSNLQAFALYTTKHQFSTSVLLSHFFKNDIYRLYVKVDYDLFPNSFFAIGNTNDNDDPEQYTPEKTGLKVYLERKVYADLKVRTGFTVENQSLQKFEAGRLLETTNVPWRNGRLDAGPILGLVWDSRDNTLVTNRGTYLSFVYTGMLYQDDGDAFNLLEFDFRSFVPVTEDIVMATQIAYEEASGDVPYYLFPSLGGQDALRGYEMNRFREKKLVLFQEDIRFPVWGPVGACLFAATGRVADDRGDLFSGKWHAGAGGGVRYFIDREDNLAVRADCAWGSDAFRFYVTFSEAF